MWHPIVGGTWSAIGRDAHDDDDGDDDWDGDAGDDDVAVAASVLERMDLQKMLATTFSEMCCLV